MTKTSTAGLTCLFALLCGCSSVPKLPDAKGELSVEDLVHLVDHAWATDKADITNEGMKLGSIKLNLAEKTTDTGEGSLDLVVVSAGAKMDVTTSRFLAITLTEPKKPGGPGVMFDQVKRPDAEKQLAAALAKAIKQAAQAARQVDEAEKADREDKLPPLSDITVSVGFNITSTVEGKLGIEFGEVKIGVSGSRTVTGSHQIDLVFTRSGAVATLPHDLQWFRNSAEYVASAQTVYNAAIAQVPNQCKASGQAWVAVMDADETIFDNSDQQLDWWQRGKSYDPAEWNTWVARGQEGLVPGARQFIETVAARCGHIVVVTNRSDPNALFRINECQATKDRLQALFGTAASHKPIDAVLCAPIGPDGKAAGDKNPRFKAIADGEIAGLKNAKIGMYIGDSITDFPDMKACPTLDALTGMQSKLGRSYFVLPNPTYGKWDGCTKTWRGPAK